MGIHCLIWSLLVRKLVNYIKVRDSRPGPGPSIFPRPSSCTSRCKLLSRREKTNSCTFVLSGKALTCYPCFCIPGIIYGHKMYVIYVIPEANTPCDTNIALKEFIKRVRSCSYGNPHPLTKGSSSYHGNLKLSTQVTW